MGERHDKINVEDVREFGARLAGLDVDDGWHGGHHFCAIHSCYDTCRVTEETHNQTSTHMSLLKQAERLFTALNTMDLDTAVAMIRPLVDIRMPMGAFTWGKAYREWISEHFRAFPDMHHEIRGITLESDRTLTFEWRATGTFTAPLPWRCPAAKSLRTARPSTSQEPSSGGLKAA